MKVKNMKSANGNSIANQFIIEDYKLPMVRPRGTMFQSYDSNITFIYYYNRKKEVLIDKNYWNYSITTGKYRNQFLGENKQETQRKIDSGQYYLIDLNE